MIQLPSSRLQQARNYNEDRGGSRKQMKTSEGAKCLSSRPLAGLSQGGRRLLSAVNQGSLSCLRLVLVFDLHEN